LLSLVLFGALKRLFALRAHPFGAVVAGFTFCADCVGLSNELSDFGRSQTIWTHK
jgi:hypothetical protein